MNKVQVSEIELLRNNNLESKHKILITTDKDKNGFDFFPRSAIKPFQIIPLLSIAKKNNIKFENEEIAIFGSSHSGQDVHVKLLLEIAKKYNINTDDIFCAPQRPMHIKTADDYISKKVSFTNLNNNCSGKHLSMLIYSKLLNVDNTNYQNIEHIVQESINVFFKQIFEISEIKYGIDVFLACVYAVYMYTVFRVKLSDEFNRILPELPELTRRVLGVQKLKI